jgi:hypothetical protein
MIIRVEVEVHKAHLSIEINDIGDQVLGLTDAIAASPLGTATGRMVAAIASGSGIRTSIILDEVIESMRKASLTS